MNKIYHTPGLLPSRRTAIAIAISTALAGTNTAQAQQVLEEIIVTATKREASLQDIPMSVMAFTNADIVREGFKTLVDYVGQIPGLAFTRREPGGTTLVMRGCATSGVAFSDNPTTSIYLDEQPISDAGVNPDVRLVDIDRVESLSGPQGTLFGAASQCGTLRIITNKPDSNEFDSWVDVSASQIEHGDLGYDLSGMVNVPLVKDKLALRLVGFYTEEAGWIDNVRRNSPGYAIPAKDPGYTGGAFNNAAFVEDDINSSTVKGARVGLRWTPNENWTIDAQAIWQQKESDGFGDSDLNEGQHAGFGLGELEQVRFGNDFWNDEWYQLALTAEARLGLVDVTVMGSFLNRQTRYDADSTAYITSWSEAFHYAAYPAKYDWGFYQGGVRTPGDLRASSWNDEDTDRWTFEARAATSADLDSRWAGIVGVFYNKSTNDTVFKANIIGQSKNCADGAGFIASPYCTYAHNYLSALHYFYFGVYQPNASDNWWTGVYHQTIKEKAVFGEISFDVTEKFTITAGGRWYGIDQDRTLKNGNSSTGDDLKSTVLNCATDAEKDNWQINGIPISRDANTCYNDSASESSDSGWVPKVNLTYHYTDDKLVYFTYSEGFRRSGVNAAKNGPFALGGEFHEFTSDGLKNFEVGFKTTWLDDRFRLNLTGYHMIWEDILIQVQENASGFFTLGQVNLPEAEINGVEASFAWLPAEGWDIRGTLGYNIAELSKEAVVFDTVLSKGERLPLSPELKTSLSVGYTLQREIFGAEPYVSGTWTYQGDSLSSLAGLGGTGFLNPVRTHDSYNLLNLRAGLNGDGWTATFFIDNVTDEVGEMFFNDRWAQTRLTVTKPRTFGINFRKYFGK